MGGIRRALLLGLGLVVTYGWMIRLGADLGWDEALNLKSYSRHPLTAVALYHEPNNHPLESLLKSVFYRVLGWDTPEYFRFTGYLFIAGWLALAWAWHRRLEKLGSICAATAIVVAMLFSSALEHQAAALRGYFLSMLLVMLYLLVLERDTGWLGEESTGPPRRALLKYGGLGALILFTVPSNVLAMPALWLFTAGALAPPEARWHEGLLRRTVRLAGVTLLLTVLLFAPILIGLATGVSALHRTPEFPAEPFVTAVTNEILLVGSQLAPRGVNGATFGLALLGLAALTLIIRPRRRLVWMTLMMIVVCLVVRLAAATTVGFPGRIKSPTVPLFAIAAVAWVHMLLAARRAWVQDLLSVVILLGCCTTIPHVVRTETFDRATSDMVSFVRTYARPEERRVLVGHAGIQFLVPYLERTLKPEEVVAGQAELDRRMGPALPPEPDDWKRRWRESILGHRDHVPLDLTKVDVLVLIEFGPREGAFSWTHRDIKELKARLGDVSSYEMDRYRVMIFEKKAP